MDITNSDSRIDDYISTLPDWQQTACQEVRKLVYAADPGVQETIKSSKPSLLTIAQGDSAN